MRANDSAIAPESVAVDSTAADRPEPVSPTRTPTRTPTEPPGFWHTTWGGSVLAALGVVSFSLTFPGTAWALEGLGPWSTVGVRLVLAGLVAGGCLLALRVPLPRRADWSGIAVVAGGVVIGFPLLTTLALRTSSTSHAAVVVGLLPLTTAALAAVAYPLLPSRRNAAPPRPSRTFWLAAVAGAAVVGAFTVGQSGGAVRLADLYLLAALLVCAAGYTEGGRLARHLPGWQVIAWALVLCLPLSAVGALLALRVEPVALTGHAVAGLLWIALGSQFAGLLVWYRGMAVIGVPRASQLQLAQPLLTLFWSATLLGEQLTPAAPLAATAVLVCIAVTQRAGR
ncbi:DMT family transporter [Streptomyces polyrhachis]|uniref:DMT family transporter n=1 Tax=Streptomyces polyrhachis TaxID=1282885 RepID=A0ABW2GAR5_9ACTN